jgi:hypothetical protein
MTAAFDLVVTSATAQQFTTLARAIAASLGEAGAEANVVEDALPRPADDRTTVVVAPHDVYPHLDLRDDDALEASLARSILICCERPSTPGWERVLPFALRAGAVYDVSDIGVATLEQNRVPARRFQLGYHPLLDRWGGGDRERPVDVAFIGSASPRRLETLAHAAAVLAGYDVDLRITPEPTAAAQADVDRTSGDDRWSLLARSKILLNVHKDDVLSFEWLRATAALCNGSVLVAEEAVGALPLEPGVHFVTGAREELPALVAELLEDPDRLASIRDEGYRWIREQAPLAAAVERLASTATTLVPLSRRRRAADAPPFPHNVPPQADVRAPDATELLQEATTLIARQGAVMKRLFFDLRLLRRQVAELELSLNGNPDRRVTTTTPAVETSAPEVTALVTLYNYEGYVAEAIESVLDSVGVDVEVLVVDDASIDNSVDAVKAVMEAHPDRPITLVEQRVNTGVQRARNFGFAAARAPFVFVLDADNLVYPNGIAKLRDALAGDSGAAFAYGLIERFNADGSTGLMNTRAWDRKLLAETHYIDAMALISVDAWRRVGGYVTDPTLELGWEDYDLWLSFAGAGYHAVHVREVVGRYRVHEVSSLAITTLDVENLNAKLRQRHADFFRSVRQPD